MERQNQIPLRNMILKSSLLVFAYAASFAVAYAIMQMITRKSAVRNAVIAAQAYWEEEQRQNNIRLFGKEDV